MKVHKTFLSHLAALLICTLSLSITTTAANADGSITKPATEVTYSCSGGTTSACPGGPTTTKSESGVTCIHCGKHGEAAYTETYCDTCGARLYYAHWGIRCDGTTTIPATSTKPHNSITKPCSHGNTSSHTVYTGTYKNDTYGYSGSSSTFKVWPITINGAGGATASVSVTGATATDAAVSGKTVTVTVGGLATGYPVKITNSATGTSTTVTVGGAAHTFTMPAKATTLTVEPAKQPQTITVQNTYNVAYNQAPFNLNATVTG